MHVNAMEAAAGEVRAAHREQCFDLIRRSLGLGDTKGDTGLWLDWIDAVAPGHSAEEVLTLTLEQLRREYGTTATMNPPVSWTAAGWRAEGRTPAALLLLAAKSVLFSADAFSDHDAQCVEIPRTEIETLRRTIARVEGR